MLTLFTEYWLDIDVCRRSTCTLFTLHISVVLPTPHFSYWLTSCSLPHILWYFWVTGLLWVNERHDCCCGCKEIHENSCSLLQAEAIELNVVSWCWNCTLTMFFLYTRCGHIIYTHTCTHTRTHVHTHMHVHAHTCTHTHTRTCIHIPHIPSYGTLAGSQDSEACGSGTAEELQLSCKTLLSLCLPHTQFSTAMSVLLLVCTSTIP